MSAVQGSGKRGLRDAVSDISGCEDCRHRVVDALFTLCGHAKAEYKVDGKIELHTIQHMRDIYVGACSEMQLREVA